jgi:hypothetical protein
MHAVLPEVTPMGSLTEHDARAYVGPERRRNRVLVTKNSEYHCRDGVCVGVRDRRTRDFVPEHPALGKRMTGGMRFSSEGGFEATSPESIFAGERLFFSSCDGDLERDIITSPLLAVERPSKDLARRYDKMRS